MKNLPKNRQNRLTKNHPAGGLFDAFVEVDLLLVRMPALPSIRAHGTVVNGRKMVIYAVRGANNRIGKKIAEDSLEAVFELQNVFAEIEERLKRQEKQ